jgi:hypothetical protein
MDNVTGLPAPATDDKLFGIVDDATMRCLSCETPVHVTDRELTEDDSVVTKLYCAECDVYDTLSE